MQQRHFVSLILLAVANVSCALKHTFVTKKDARIFIGPIGVPFGFLENGTHEMTVSEFKLHIPKPHSSGRSLSKEIAQGHGIVAEDIKGLHPGFLLKRFKTETEFARYTDRILESPDVCGFQDFLSDFDDVGNKIVKDDVIDDPTVAIGPGVIDGGASGIFLSMKNIDEMWNANTPTLTHHFIAEEAGYYFLFYQICLEDNFDKDKFLFRRIASSFQLDFKNKNLDMLGNISYLTAGEMPLPHIFLYFSVSYALMLGMWVRSLHTNDTHPNSKPTVYAIHHIMSAVVALKVLSVFFESVRYHYIRLNGHAELWSFLYYGITFLKGIFLFTTILLIGSGWSYFKPYLTSKERKIIFFVFFLQIIDNIAMVVLNSETMGEKFYKDWSAILHLVDIISCCAILVPIVWQVNNLEQSIESHERDEQGKRAESLRLESKLELFRSFYLVVVGYIYFTRIVVYLFASTLSYDHTWLKYLVTELGTILFYLIVGIKFRPTVESGYDTVSSEDAQGVELGETAPSNTE